MPSILGKQHEAEAVAMTKRAAIAVVLSVMMLGVVGTAALVPSVLVLPIPYLVAEVLFAIIFYYRYLLLSYQPVKHRPLFHDPIVAFERAMQHLQQFADIRHFLSIWFHGASFEDIKRDNVVELVAYAFWYKTRDEVAAEGREHELMAMVEYIEDKWGVVLPPGHNPTLTFMSHLWEPTRCWYQPLAFYLFMEVAAFLGSVALRAAGFREASWMGITYYTKNMAASATTQPSSSGKAAAQEEGRSGAAVGVAASAGGAGGLGDRDRSSDSSSGGEVPLVLLHGIGMGLIPYIGWLFNMAATGRPVIALQLKHVAMRWVLWVPTVDEVAEVTVAILRREGVGACCLVGHSYGSAVASRLLQQHPEKIVQACMIDPVCFAMFMPNLLRNFLYESPRTGSFIGDFMMMCAARDLHVSATLSRRFFWSDVILWEEQIPPGSLVVLSGCDVLMAAEEVKSWLEQRTDAVVMYHPSLPHAGFLMDLTWQQRILQQLLPLLDHKTDQQLKQQQQQESGEQLQQDGQVDKQQQPAAFAKGDRRWGNVAPAILADSSNSHSRHGSCGSSMNGGGPRMPCQLLDVHVDNPQQQQGPGTPHQQNNMQTSSSFVEAGSCSSRHSSSSHSSSFELNAVAVPAHVGVSGAAPAGPISGDGVDEVGVTSSSPFAAAAATTIDSRWPAAQQHPQQLDLEPLQSWTGVLPQPAPVSCGFTPPESSACSIAAEVESPRTVFSACSSQSWADFAAKDAREAAAAATALLAPVLAMQQRQRQQQQLQQVRQEQQYATSDAVRQGGVGCPVASHIHPEMREAGSAHSHSAAAAAAGAVSRRKGVLRRVEVLLHRRQGRGGGGVGRGGGVFGSQGSLAR